MGSVYIRNFLDCCAACALIVFLCVKDLRVAGLSVWHDRSLHGQNGNKSFASTSGIKVTFRVVTSLM